MDKANEGIVWIVKVENEKELEEEFDMDKYGQISVIRVEEVADSR